MKKYLPLLIILFAILLFFNPVFRKGFVPFPGDLLVGHYAPWNSYSFSGYAPGGVPHKAQGIDVVRQLYPWKYFSIDRMKKGQWPLWNPYNFSGNPAAANFQTGAFYPLNAVFLLPFNSGWTIFIILQPLLAFFFMYLFLKNLKLGMKPSVMGALAFSLSLYMAVWMEYGNIGHSLLWLPLLLLLIDKLKEKFTWRYLAGFILVLSFSVLAGYIQQIIYGLIITGSYFIFRHFERNHLKIFFKKSFLMLVCILISLLLCAIQILPTVEIFRQSARNIYSLNTIKNLLLPWYYFLTVAVPDFFGNPANRNYWITGTYIERVSYIGLVPLLFAVYKLFFLKDKTSRFFLAAAIFTLILAVNFWPAQFIYGLRIPIIGTTVPTRILAQFSFAAAVLSALGLEEFIKNKPKLTGFIPVLIIFLLAGLAALFGFKFHLFANILQATVAKRNLAVSGIIFVASLVLIFFGVKFEKRKNAVIWLLLFLTVFDLFFFFQRITPFAPNSWIYPQTEIFNYLKKEQGIWRFWGYGTSGIETNFSTREKMFSPNGVDPLFINRYGELVSTSFNGAVKNPLPRADVNVAPGYGTTDLRNNQYRQRILDLLGVRFLLYKNENNTDPDYLTFPEERYQLFKQIGSWQIYKNREAVPRIFLTSDYAVEKDDKNIIKTIFNSNFPLNSRLILEEEPKVKLDKTDNSTVNYQLIDYSPEKVVIKTETSQSKLLFLSDNYFSGWQATVDGKTTLIYRTDYTFRSVVVPAGVHTVEFTYHPATFFNGLKISLLTFMFIVIVTLLSLITKTYDRKMA
ncbi:MAG: YfhO family protein [Patescibacteria group bacterium]|nr:YfhO family protein [Patescibacteria group bacterium]